MQYLISFLEGFITVISPCILPLLPLYVTYFAGNDKDGNPKNVLKNSLGFVLGFTIVFVSLGALAGSIGMFLKMYSYWVNIILGIIVILLSLIHIFLITTLSRYTYIQSHIKKQLQSNATVFYLIIYS